MLPWIKYLFWYLALCCSGYRKGPDTQAFVPIAFNPHVPQTPYHSSDENEDDDVASDDEWYVYDGDWHLKQVKSDH